MRWGFRKSFSIGGIFRLNLSKGGIGASVGVKGARVSIDPRGRSALNVGAGGVQVRQSLAGARRTRRGRGNPSIAIAAVVVLVAVTAFLLAPSAPKPAAVSKPVTVTPAQIETTTPAAVPVDAPEKPSGSAKPKESGRSTNAPSWMQRPGEMNAAPRPSTSVESSTGPAGTAPAAPATNGAGKVWVEGYRKKDGTMVDGYWRDR